jgi:hypothetical protein
MLACVLFATLTLVSLFCCGLVPYHNTKNNFDNITYFVVQYRCLNLHLGEVRYKNVPTVDQLVSQLVFSSICLFSRHHLERQEDHPL